MGKNITWKKGGRGSKIIAVGKNITWKKGKGKQYHLPFNFEAVGKNIKWERGEDGKRTVILRKKIKI